MVAVGLKFGGAGDCCGIDVGFMWNSCGIDVESPVALLGDCCDIAMVVIDVGWLGYCCRIYDIAVGWLGYCCDLAVGFLRLLRDCCKGCRDCCRIDVEFLWA